MESSRRATARRLSSTRLRRAVICRRTRVSSLSAFLLLAAFSLIWRSSWAISRWRADRRDSWLDVFCARSPEAASNRTASTAANSAKSTAQTAVNNAQKAVDDNVNALAAEGLTDEAKAELEAAAEGLKTTLAEAQADLEQKTAAADKALAAAFEAIQPTLDEVKTKLAAGEDFEALMEQYNTDPGMKTEPGKTNGYAVCEGFSSFDPAFVTAAMGLEKIGDVSEPVKSDSYGYYIIRYQSDIEEGPVALEDVRSIVEPAALNAKQNNTYNDTVKKWTDEAKVKTYIDRLSN